MNAIHSKSKRIPDEVFAEAEQELAEQDRLATNDVLNDLIEMPALVLPAPVVVQRRINRTLFLKTLYLGVTVAWATYAYVAINASDWLIATYVGLACAAVVALTARPVAIRTPTAK
jgi:hypothetical protein